MSAGEKILVTGASGFVGHALCARLCELGHTVRCANRSALPNRQHGCNDTVAIGEFHAGTDWSAALSGVSVVFHLAARTHMLQDTAHDSLEEYRRVNVEGSRSLAYAAARAGVRRLVYLSSIKVNGEHTTGFPFDESSTPRPEDAYGLTKWEAEQVLRGIAQSEGMGLAILRPPLVYGPGVKGNFLRLLHWTSRGVPLPLASVDNRRSLIYVDNLADALVAAGMSPAAAGKTYLVSDGIDVSTPGLIRAVANALGILPRLFPCPPSLLMMGATVLGKHEQMRRLIGSLQINSEKFRRELAWTPHFQPVDGLLRTAQWYHSQFPVKSTT